MIIATTPNKTTNNNKISTNTGNKEINGEGILLSFILFLFSFYSKMLIK